MVEHRASSAFPGVARILSRRVEWAHQSLRLFNRLSVRLRGGRGPRRYWLRDWVLLSSARGPILDGPYRADLCGNTIRGGFVSEAHPNFLLDQQLKHQACHR